MFHFTLLMLLSGAEVAIKIQRPGCEELIAVDLFILRWYCAQVRGLKMVYLSQCYIVILSLYYYCFFQL